MSTSATQRAAAFFDLDKTIIARSSALAFALPLYRGGLIRRRDLLSSAAVQASFALRSADAARTDRLRDHLTSLCTGWDVVRLRVIVAQTLREVIEPIVFPAAINVIESHRAAGRDVVIVSSSNEDVVQPIGDLLAVDDVIATSLVIDGGRYTGEVDRYVYGQEKATAIGQLAAARTYELSDSYAYSDSITDLPMLELVGHPNIVNPDRALRALAAERGWDTHSWRTPRRAQRRRRL